MKIDNNRNGSFYIATARYNHNTLIITDVGTYGPLKVLAQKDKYFNSYEPTFMYFNGITLKKITKATLKKDFQHALRTDPNYFTVNEREKLGNLFKIKIILKPTLQEKKIKKVIVKKNTTKKSTLPIYEYQTERGRKFRISAKNQKIADSKAVEWRDKNAKNSVIHYNFRVD